MKKNLLLFMLLLGGTIWGQKATYVVIAEIYPGGGNSGATYTNDYIVLYNPTDVPVDLSSWSVQYQAATTTTTPWSTTASFNSNLSGTISAGGYYLIQGTSGANGSALPVTPNVSGSMSLATTGGKVALASKQTGITGIGDASVVDFVGWGNANVYEGASAAAAISNNTSSIRRKDNSGNSTYGSNGSGWDTNVNGSDFYTETNLIANQPLPVELTSFTSNVIGNKIELNWKTATEVNNYGFEIERLAVSNQQLAKSRELNANSWVKIGFVEGNGNSNSPKSYSYKDEPTGGKEFNYRLKQIDKDGTYEYSDIVTAVLENVSAFVLEQNYPNPFNPATMISYTIPERVNVKLKVYDMIAQQVAELVNGSQEAGHYQVTFDGSDLPSGVYFYKLEAGNFVEVKKFMLVK